ncbi:MAG: tetratricopeptide repeat protein [Candidatus Cloacimonadales bacterium]
MKKITILLLLIFCSSLLAESYVDTLEAQLPKLEGNQRYETLRALTILLRDDNAPRSLYYALLQAQYARQSGVSSFRLGAKKNLAVAWMQNDLPQISAEIVKDILSDYQLVNAEEKIAETRMILAEIYFELAKYQAAERELLKVIEYYNQQQDQVKIADTFLQLGKIYYEMGQPPIAYEYIESAQKLYRQNKEQVKRSNALFTLAEYQQAAGQYDAALKNFQKARNNYENNVVIDKLIASVIKEVELYMLLQQESEAFYHLKRMDKMLQNIGDEKNRLLILMELAELAWQQAGQNPRLYLQEIEAILQRAPLGDFTTEINARLSNYYDQIQMPQAADRYRRRLMIQRHKLKERDLKSWQQIEDLLAQQRQQAQREYEKIAAKMQLNNWLWAGLLALILISAIIIIKLKYKN